MPDAVAANSPLQLVRLARPGHWIKNGIVVVPILFARPVRTDDPSAWLAVALATLAFCLASSFGYVVNDLADRAGDRLHPDKRNRPLAAGLVSPGAAIIEAVVLALAGLGVALAVNPITLYAVAAFGLLHVGYTGWLKHHVLVDVICIALGFVLRAAGGAVAIAVSVSPWLIICTFTLCLFMGFCKRRNEAATLGDPVDAANHRATLVLYSPELLTHLITLSAAVAIISYLIYASHPLTVERFGTIYLLYTLPPVIYGVARFAMLSIAGRYSGPNEIILRDRPFQIAVLLWVASAVILINCGPAIQAWVGSHYQAR
ncbi:MAG: Decaprenyl-phosphate phosphoribosyltransferase [Phycisphaerae bacterium]|nr:Decaprenyl-phosphate phosphoribosyltransferase [Phycisphaerae bacterium]